MHPMIAPVPSAAAAIGCAGRRWRVADAAYGEHLKKRRDDRRHDPWYCRTCSRLESATLLAARAFERAVRGAS